MPQSRTIFQHIFASWLSMKPWVKNWLFFLNAVFIAASAFLEEPAAKWILFAYVTSGLLLVGFIIKQRGLTRILGIAHLVPWVPLLIYIVLRLTSGIAGPIISFTTAPLFCAYLHCLLTCLIVCLSLDAWDVVRYLRGERYVLGSLEAFRAGASRLSPKRLPCETTA
jgi:hypothetical protein